MTLDGALREAFREVIAAELRAALEPIAATVRDVAARLPAQHGTVSEYARLAGISIATARRRIKAGEVPTRDSGRLLRVDLSAALRPTDDIAVAQEARRARGAIR